jgi:hypothetical protein
MRVEMFTVLEIANRRGVVAKTATAQPTRIQRLLQKRSIVLATVWQEISARLKSRALSIRTAGTEPYF